MSDEEKLGPCPLCGGSGEDLIVPAGMAYCKKCRLTLQIQVWNRLSALAEQNKRMMGALDKIQKSCHKHDYRTIWETCEEALK